jgi:hypothetical protein
MNATTINSVPAALHMNLGTGFYHDAAVHSAVATTVAGVAGRFDLLPFIPSTDLPGVTLNVNVTGAVASALAKVVVYSAAATGLPDALIVESTDLDCSTTGVKPYTYSYTFKAGTVYWLGVRTSSTATLTAIVATQLRSLAKTSSGGSLVGFRRTLAYSTVAPTTWGYSAAEWTGIGTSYSSCLIGL